MHNTLQQFNIKNRQCTTKTVKSVVDMSTLFFQRSFLSIVTCLLSFVTQMRNTNIKPLSPTRQRCSVVRVEILHVVKIKQELVRR